MAEPQVWKILPSSVLRGRATLCVVNGAMHFACAQYCRQSNQQDSLDHATTDYVNAAIVALQLGDEKTYAELREEMATRFKDGRVAHGGLWRLACFVR
jgi:hypothetical protein